MFKSQPIGHKKSPKSKFLVLSLWNASLVSPFISAFPCLYESFSFPHQIFCSTILFRELSRKTAEAVQRVQCCDGAVLASHWSVSPSSASDWLAAVTRPATHNTLFVTWPRLWPAWCKHSDHACISRGHVCVRVLSRRVRTCQPSLSSVTGAKYVSSMRRSCLSLFVYLDSGRAGHGHQRGVSTRARDSESISEYQHNFLF